MLQGMNLSGTLKGTERTLFYYYIFLIEDTLLLRCVLLFTFNGFQGCFVEVAWLKSNLKHPEEVQIHNTIHKTIHNIKYQDKTIHRIKFHLITSVSQFLNKLHFTSTSLLLESLRRNFSLTLTKFIF